MVLGWLLFWPSLPCCLRERMCASCRARVVRSMPISLPLRPRAAVRRARHHRRTLPIRLHTGAEHDPPQSYLRHTAGGARLPRPAMVLPTHRLYGARAGGHPYRHRLLSPRCTRLDQKTGRANAEAHLSSRQGACGSLSALLANVRWLTNPGVGCSNPSRPVRMEYKALANSTQRGL